MQIGVDSESSATEEAFFARGLLEEKATLEALSRRPAPSVRPRPAPAPRAIVALLGLGVLGIATYASLRLVAGRRRPRPPAAGPVEARPEPEPPVAATPPEQPQIPPPAPVPAQPQPPVAEAASSACRTAIAAKRYHEMLEDCDRAAAAAGPDSADLALRVANVELERGRPASALAWAERTVEANPRLAEAYVIIGSVEQERGRVSAARGAYARYLALAPTGRYATDVRAILRRR